MGEHELCVQEVSKVASLVVMLSCQGQHGSCRVGIYRMRVGHEWLLCITMGLVQDFTWQSNMQPKMVSQQMQIHGQQIGHQVYSFVHRPSPPLTFDHLGTRLSLTGCWWNMKTLTSEGPKHVPWVTSKTAYQTFYSPTNKSHPDPHCRWTKATVL